MGQDLQPQSLYVAISYNSRGHCWKLYSRENTRGIRYKVWGNKNELIPSQKFTSAMLNSVGLIGCFQVARYNAEDKIIFQETMTSWCGPPALDSMNDNSGLRGKMSSERVLDSKDFVMRVLTDLALVHNLVKCRCTSALGCEIQKWAEEYGVGFEAGRFKPVTVSSQLCQLWFSAFRESSMRNDRDPFGLLRNVGQAVVQEGK